MANIFNVMLIWFSLCSICYLTVTAYDDDDDDGIAEYEGFAAESSEIECYFKAKLNNCKAGKTLYTYLVKDDKEAGSVTIDSSTVNAVCLPAKCTLNGGKVSISRKLDIAGENEEAKPDVLPKGFSKGLFKTESDCKSQTSAIVTIQCTKTDLSAKEGQEQVMEREMMQMQQEADDDKSSFNDNDDSKDAFKMMKDEDDEEGTKGNGDQTMMQENDHDDIPADGQSVDMDSLEVNIQEGMTAKIQFNNWFRGNMYANCGHRRAIYYVRSGHSNHYGDRIWHFGCKVISRYNYNSCYWTGYMNSFHAPLVGHCHTNYVMIGIHSYFHGSYRDRRYRLLCCRAPYHRTRYCYFSGFVNGWRGWMNYSVGGRRVFTGMYGYYQSCYKDRKFGFANCYY